jgi:hypothetical protein
MKTFKIVVPYTATYTIQDTTTLEITEDEILDYFEVDDMDEVSAEELEEFFKEQAEEIDIPRNLLAAQFADEVRDNATDFEVQVDDIIIEELA